MKRIWAAVALLGIAAGLCIAEFMIVMRGCDEYIESISTAVGYAENDDYKSASKICEKTEKGWLKTHRKMNVFLIHTNVEEVTFNMAMLKTFAKNEDESMFLAYAEKTKRQLLSLKESELPYFENIL